MKRVLVMSALVLLGSLALADWVSIGPAGGPMYTGAASPSDPATLYFAPKTSPCPLVRSTDGGASWSLSTGTLYGYPYSLTVDPADPSRIFANQISVLYRTTNAGGTWTSSSYLSGCYAEGLAVNPANSQSMYAAGYYYDSSAYRACVLRSGDAGTTWDSLRLDTTTYSMGYSACVDPADTTIAYIGAYAYGYSRVFKTTDAGATWQQTPLNATGNYVYSLHVSPLDHNIVLAGTYSGGIWRSTDAGASWARTATCWYVYQLAAAPSCENVIYAVSDTAVYRSLDTGRTWTLCRSGLLGKEARAVLAVDSTTVFAGTTAGIFASDNRGASWQMTATEFPLGRIPTMAPTPNNSTLYIEFQDNAMFSTTNQGASWTRCPEFLACGNICGIGFNPLDPNVIWALEGSG
jgi:photosystem II stability/assembly factor-like uncharacterized protein